MKQKIKNALLETLSAIITGILCLGFWGLGFFLSFKGYLNVSRTLWIAVCCVCAVIILALIIVNIVGAKVLTKKLSEMKTREIYDLSETLKSDTEKNLERAEKSVSSTIALAYTYVAFVIVLMLILCFATGVLIRNADSASLAILLLIVIFFTMWGLTNVFFAPLVSPAPPDKYLLDRSRFPLFYETVGQAAKKSGCNLNLLIYACGDGASLSTYKHNAVICINYLYAATLTREELFNVMLHEFAHINNADVKRTKKFYRAEQRFSNDTVNVIISFGRMVLLPLPAAAVIFKTNVYNVFASRYHEAEADKALIKLGDPQKSIDALAKTHMIGVFSSLPHRELDYDFFAPEQLTGDYAAQELSLFLKHRDIYGKKWCEMMEKELPARIDSHPTFRNRMAALGCERYDAYNREADPAYVAEQQEVIKTADRIMNDENAENYKKMRREAYLERKKEIDEYAAKVENGEEIPDHMLFTYLQAHFGVDDDTAIEIADKMIAALPNPAFANYYKGLILFNRNDGGCVDCMKAASTDNEELAMNAYDIIGQYALKTGDEALLNEYRSTAPDAVQSSKDKDNRNKPNKNSTFEKCDIDRITLQQLTDGIDAELMKHVSAIYIAVYTDADGGRHYPVAVSVKGVNSAKVYEIFGGIYNYLFDYRGKYDFILLPPNSPLSRKVKKCEGALIYSKRR